MLKYFKWKCLGNKIIKLDKMVKELVRIRNKIRKFSFLGIVENGCVFWK